jgi:bifunctional non-homologous end joining protein LigD
MLATPWPAPFIDPGWCFEVKWDGVRTLAYIEGDQNLLRSRRGGDVSGTYPEIAALRVSEPVVLDGEIVALDPSGRPSFELLQQRMNLTGRTRINDAVGRLPTTYVVFDLLYLDGDLTARPLEERRNRLLELKLRSPALASDVVDGDGEALFEAVKASDLEGVVGKRKGSAYLPGRRSPDWRKVANRHRVQTVVGGYLRGEGARAATFGSLLVGLRRGDALRWVGAVGSGFEDRSLTEIRSALDQMERRDPPFEDVSEVMGEPVWVEPVLIAVIEYKEWTTAGRLRAPVFKGFSGDPIEDVTWEKEGPGT